MSSSTFTRLLQTHLRYISSIFFFNATATTEIYTLSLHDALPIFGVVRHVEDPPAAHVESPWYVGAREALRSEEHTSELQSPDHLVCRLLLEKKNQDHAVLVAVLAFITPQFPLYANLLSYSRHIVD